jgi:phenylacetate-coenzyme A ligase PaaK-like adenylate-forming protein
MRVRFEPEPAVDPSRWNGIAADAQARIHKALHVRLDVVAVEPLSLPRFELKTKRIIDRRPKELRRALDR